MSADYNTNCGIYLITIHKHRYVGLSRNLKYRKWDHLNSLKKHKHPNTHMQRAYNKYQQYSFTVLECLPSESLANREVWWIQHLRTHQEGMNRNKGGIGFVGKTCTWNGIEYPSVYTCAQALGISVNSLWERLHKGFTCDQDMHRPKSTYAQTCVWNSVTYASINEASQDLGIDWWTLKGWIGKGYTCTQDIKPPSHHRPCHWNGIKYPSLTSAAKALGIGVATMKERIDKGYTCDSDLKNRGS